NASETASEIDMKMHLKNLKETKLICEYIQLLEG
nr:hypothetical protein [Tanacetum cinerariifolium]